MKQVRKYLIDHAYELIDFIGLCENNSQSEIISIMDNDLDIDVNIDFDVDVKLIRDAGDYWNPPMEYYSGSIKPEKVIVYNYKDETKLEMELDEELTEVLTEIF